MQLKLGKLFQLETKIHLKNGAKSYQKMNTKYISNI